MKDYYLTKLNENVYLLERLFSEGGEDFTEVLAYDSRNERVENIGTSYDGMSYYYNKDYVIFATEDDIEFVFDVNNFDYITDERKKRKAFDTMMNGSMLEILDYERTVIRLDKRNDIIKTLSKKLK